VLLLNVYGVNKIRQTEVHTAEPSAFEFVINSVRCICLALWFKQGDSLLFLLFTFALNVPLELSKQNTAPHPVLEISSLTDASLPFQCGWKTVYHM